MTSICASGFSPWNNTESRRKVERGGLGQRRDEGRTDDEEEGRVIRKGIKQNGGSLRKQGQKVRTERRRAAERTMERKREVKQSHI